MICLIITEQPMLQENGGKQESIQLSDMKSESSPQKRISNPARMKQSLEHRKRPSGRKLGFLRSLSDKKYLDSSEKQFHNRRLLLTCENSLHIIDGSKYRYYVGVIDFFTQFQCRQQIGKLLKDVKTCCGNHSTERPDVYAERFYQFISERVV